MPGIGGKLRGEGHAPSLIAALVHFEVSFMVWVLLGVLGAFVASDLGLNSAQKGLMVAIPPLGGAICRILLGALADRCGLKKVGLVSLALVLVPAAWGAVGGGTYPQVLGIGMLLGVAGASFAVSLPLASRWYPPERQGLALGIAGAGNSGTIVTALVAPRLAESLGWHAVFGLDAVPVTAAWVAFALLAKEPPRPARPMGNPLRLLAEPDARALSAIYAVSFGGFVGLAGYLPMYFVDRFELSKVTAASLAAVAAGAGSLLRPVGGWLADRHGGRSVVRAVLLAVAALLGTVALGRGLGPTAVALVATLGALGTANGAVFQMVPQSFADRMGAATGLVGAAGGLGGFLLPFGLGAFHSVTGSFAAGFLTFAVCAVAARRLLHEGLSTPATPTVPAAPVSLVPAGEAVPAS